MDHSIPLIDIGPLFGAPGPARDLSDQAIMRAAAASGFMVVRGFPPEVPVGRAARADLLRLFQLPETETRKLWRQKFDPAHPNVYRGWFPLQPGGWNRCASPYGGLELATHRPQCRYVTLRRVFLNPLWLVLSLPVYIG